MNVVETKPNIRRAIERSQRARNAFNRRRRRTAIAVSLLIVATVPASFAFLGVGGSDIARAAETGARSLSDLLAQRSPGERTQAELTKTKKARALAKVRHTAAPPARGPSPLELARILLPPVEEFPVYLATKAQPPLSFFVNPPPGGGGGGVIVTPPGGGGGGVVSPPEQIPPGGGNPPPQPTELVVPPPAVPEPGTWAMLLLGFGLMGWSLRRERLQLTTARAA